jgi:hypothetical protein
LPAAPPELELTPAEDAAAPLVAALPVVSPSFVELQPTADSATTTPRETSSVTALFMGSPFRHTAFFEGSPLPAAKATRTAASLNC